MNFNIYPNLTCTTTLGINEIHPSLSTVCAYLGALVHIKVM